MASNEHIDLLAQGAITWNKWRTENPDVKPDFQDFDFVNFQTDKNLLSKASGINEEWIYNYWKAKTINLINVDLSNALLKRSKFSAMYMIKSDFSGADFSGAVMNDVVIKESNLNAAIINDVNLRGATIVNSNFVNTIISNSYIFGASAWGENALGGSIQSNLIITPNGEEIITVDDIQDANFIYNLFRTKQSIKRIIDNLSSKVVFILGRFNPERRFVLEAMKEKLHFFGFITVIFDFDKPKNRGLTDTVLTIASLSKFIIADLTDGRSVQQELQLIAPHLTTVIIQPVLQRSEVLYGMIGSIQAYPWVLPIFEYDSLEHLLSSMKEKIIDAVEERIKKIK